MLAVICCIGIVLQSFASHSTAPDLDTRRRASQILQLELEIGPGAAAPERLEALRRAARAAALELSGGSRIATALTNACERSVAAGDAVEGLMELREFARERALDLVFEPKVESPRPDHFPRATPVGEISILQYPSYRMARASIARSLLGGRNGAFSKLFRHIQSNGIAMTAPVEMTYKRDATVERLHSMGFLYRKPEFGPLGQQGEVEVVDIPEALVLSLGMRGSGSDANFTRGLEDLRRWLAEHPEWKESGPARAMGWNSPMVPDARTFFEIQIPIARALPAQEASRQAL